MQMIKVDWNLSELSEGSTAEVSNDDQSFPLNLGCTDEHKTTWRSTILFGLKLLDTVHCSMRATQNLELWFCSNCSGMCIVWCSRRSKAIKSAKFSYRKLQSLHDQAPWCWLRSTEHYMIKVVIIELWFFWCLHSELATSWLHSEIFSKSQWWQWLIYSEVDLSWQCYLDIDNNDDM